MHNLDICIYKHISFSFKANYCHKISSMLQMKQEYVLVWTSQSVIMARVLILAAWQVTRTTRRCSVLRQYSLQISRFLSQFQKCLCQPHISVRMFKMMEILVRITFYGQHQEPEPKFLCNLFKIKSHLRVYNHSRRKNSCMFFFYLLCEVSWNKTKK